MVLDNIQEYGSSRTYGDLQQRYVPLNGLTGQKEIVAAVADTQIQVEVMILTTLNAVTWTFRSGNEPIFVLLLSAKENIIQSLGGKDKLLFSTTAGAALNINLSADSGVGSGIYIQYRERS